jgi:hypothetical protein
VSWQHLIPGLVEAVREERFNREIAFTDGLEVLGGGFRVRKMLVKDYVTLRTVENPIITHGKGGILDLVQVLWMMHPEYGPNRWFKKWVFLRFVCSRLYTYPPLYHQIYSAVQKWLNRVLQDLPSGGPPSDDKSYFSDIAFLVWMLRPWQPETVMNMPIDQALQYSTISRLEKGLNVSNPSDDLIARWQKQRHAEVSAAENAGVKYFETK